MGTRHLIAVVKGGTHKIAQYGQWDGYPSGQGTTVVRFLIGEGNYFKLKDAVDNVHYAEDGEIDRILAETGNGDLILKQWFTMEESDRHNVALPGLNRDLGADILTLVAEGFTGPLLDSWSFGEDGLFCEWAYVIDCDTDTLEVYESGPEGETLPGHWDHAAEGVRKVFTAPVADLITWNLGGDHALDPGFTEAFARAVN